MEKLPNKPEENILENITRYLNTNDFKSLKAYVNKHPEIVKQENRQKIINLAEAFFLQHLDNPEDQDIDELNAFINLNICPLEEIKNDVKITEAIVKTIKELKKEQNNTIIARIKNLDIVREEVLSDAA